MNISSISSNDNISLFLFSEINKKIFLLKKEWDNLQSDLKNGRFVYSDINTALTTPFLHEFNELFINKHGYKYFEKNLNTIFKNYYVGRGVVLGDSEPKCKPHYQRFIPDSNYIKSPNRFSPKGKDWLYLSICSPKVPSSLTKIISCSKMECRVSNSDSFYFCKFKSTKSNKKIIDLTQSIDSTYDSINNNLNNEALRAVKKDVALKKENINSFEDIINNCNELSKKKINELQIKHLVMSLSKMLSETLFNPINTNDKDLIYAPFHCIAQYFLSLNYSGIIYKSTVYNSAKNMVLFDKTLAIPFGLIMNIHV